MKNNPQIVYIPTGETRKPGNREYLHSLAAGAWLPFVQSLITGGLGGILLFILALKLRWRDPWLHALIFWLIVQALAWLYLQRHWLSLSGLEKLTGLDLNGDGVTGKPEPPQTVRLQISEVTEAGHYKAGHFIDLPISPEKLTQLAKGLITGAGFSERNWTGRGGLFSQGEFRTLRNEMLRRGLLELASSKDPRQGYKLTRGGAAAMRYLAGKDTNPPAPGDLNP